MIYPIKLNTYLGAVVLSHDAYSSNSAKSIERLTTTKNGVRNDDLSTIVLRKVLVKDSSAYTAGGYTYHAGAKSVQFNTIYKKTFGVLLMPTVAPELTNKPPHMVLFNNDGVGGVKNDGFNAIAYYDVLNRDYNDNVAFFWIAVGI